MCRTLLTTHFICWVSIVVITGRRKCDRNVTLSACHVIVFCRNEPQTVSVPFRTHGKQLTLRITTWKLTAVTGRTLYSPVQLAVYHSVFVLPQLVGAPTIRMHDHFWPLSILDVQHHARLRVLNVEWLIHKQDHLYSWEQNVAAYAGVPKI